MTQSVAFATQAEDLSSILSTCMKTPGIEATRWLRLLISPGSSGVRGGLSQRKVMAGKMAPHIKSCLQARLENHSQKLSFDLSSRARAHTHTYTTHCTPHTTHTHTYYTHHTYIHRHTSYLQTYCLAFPGLGPWVFRWRRSGR